MVKISVVIPVYNVEIYLEECLESIIHQTLDDIEIICINDGSTDGSLNILNEYANKDSRIKVITQENKGLSDARNTGLKYCTGEYISFIDSDDYVSKNLFELTYLNAISNNSDVVIYKIARFNERDNFIDYNSINYNFDEIFPNQNFNDFIFNYKDVKDFVLNKLFSACIKIYKKEFLDQYDDFIFPEGLAFEDVIFNVKTFLRANRISFVPEFLYYYRSNPNSIIHNSSYCFDMFEIVDLVEKFLKDNKHYYEFYMEFNLFKFIQIYQQISSTDSEKFFQMAKIILEDIDASNFNEYNLKIYNLIINSENYSDYLKIKYESRFEILNNETSLIINNNKLLKKQIKKYEKLNASILNSRSMKLTSLFRLVSNLIWRK